MFLTDTRWIDEEDIKDAEFKPSVNVNTPVRISIRLVDGNTILEQGPKAKEMWDTLRPLLAARDERKPQDVSVRHTKRQ